MSRENPRLIYCSVTGFGQTGPYAKRAGYDLMAQGMAGVMDYRREVVRYATYYGWQNLPLAAMLEERLDLPVVLDNDVNALVVAEHW